MSRSPSERLAVPKPSRLPQPPRLCESLWCNHSAVMNADRLPDEMPLRALCPRMVCTACGLIGADVRPDWSAHTNTPPN